MVDAAMSTAAPDPERDSAEGRREERNARRAARQTLLTIFKKFSKVNLLPKVDKMPRVIFPNFPNPLLDHFQKIFKSQFIAKS